MRAERPARLSRFAEDRLGLNALVRLGLAIRDPRGGYWLTPRGAALLDPLTAPAPRSCRALRPDACGGA